MDLRADGPFVVCGLIGNPVSHSLSPIMHNAAFRHCRLPFVYAAWQVESERLAAALTGIAALGIRGINVTLPHKVAVVSLLSEVDDEAREIGAVNTIVNDHGTLRGYNTDAAGFASGFIRSGVEVRGRRVLLLGAGGAAHAAAYALAGMQARLTILNRTLAAAQVLVERIREKCSHSVEVATLTPDSITSAMAHADIVVNATSVGMWPQIEASPVPRQCLRRDMVVYDLVYRPRHTRLLRDAQEAGAVCIDGLEMLVGQGMLAFTLWTGNEAPLAVMREAVTRALE